MLKSNKHIAPLTRLMDDNRLVSCGNGCPFASMRFAASNAGDHGASEPSAAHWLLMALSQPVR